LTAIATETVPETPTMINDNTQVDADNKEKVCGLFIFDCEML
jgi:uncharacterized protein YuzE